MQKIHVSLQTVMSPGAEDQTIKCPKEKDQKDDLQNKRSSNTNSTKLWVNSYARREISACPTSGTRRVYLVTNPMISYKGSGSAYDKWDIFVVIYDTNLSVYFYCFGVPI
jgi:hypothetical protein